MPESPVPGPNFVPGRVEYADGVGAAAGLVGYDPLASGLPGYAGTTEYVVAGVVGANGHHHRGTVVNEYAALTIPAFWSAVRFLSETIAQLPADVCRKVGGVRQRLDGHPVETAMNVTANELADPFVVRETLLAHAIVWGNGYLYIDRDDAGQWTGQLFNLLPNAVRPFRFIGASGAVEQWYAVWLPGLPQPTAVRASDVIHVTGLGPDGMQGYPVVQVMRENLKIARAAEAFGAEFFDNGGHLGGAIETDQKLTDAQVETLKAQVRDGYSGVRNAHKFMILIGGAKAKTLTLPPDSAQYIETRKLAVLDVCRILRVFPWYVFELDRATWGNAGQQGVDTVKYSLAPWVVKLEQQCNRKLLTPAEQADGLFVKFNLDALQRGDHVQQLDSTTKRLSAGVTDIDEERALYDLPPLADGLGKLRFVPANWQVLQTPPPAPADPAAPALPPPVNADDDAQRFDAARPAAVDRSHLAPLVRSASDRVAAKVTAATANALAKYPNAATDAGHRDSFDRFAAAFADEMAGYATDAVAPMLETAHALTPLPAEPADLADTIGRTYADALRPHLKGLPDRPDATPPSLAPIIIDALTPVEVANV